MIKTKEDKIKALFINLYIFLVYFIIWTLLQHFIYGDWKPMLKNPASV